MRHSSDLHALIHALTPTEKRYFKIFASRHVQQGQNNYMRIFDLVEAQAQHDEEAIIEAIDPKLRGQFAVQKNYLHKLILKSLRNYHAEATVDFQIKELLMNVELLLRKGLVQQAQKQLSKAEKLALTHERLEVMAEVAGLNMMLLMKDASADLDRLEQRLKQTIADSAIQQERLLNIQAYRRISFQMLMMNRRDPQALTPESRAAYAALMADPLMTGPGNALSRRAELYYRQSVFVERFAQSDLVGAYEASQGIVALMEQNPHLIQERPENYPVALQNQVLMSTFSQPAETSRALLAQLRGFADRFPDIRFDEATLARVPVFAANIELRMLVKHRQYDEAASALPALVAQLEAGYPYNVNEGYVLVDAYFMAATLCLHRRDFRQALAFVHKLINMDGLNADHEHFLDTRILYIVILFEADEPQLLESALSSTQRYLQQKHKLFHFEKVLLEAIRRASGLQGAKREAALRKLHQDLTAAKESSGELRPINQFDILGWLDARLQQRP